MGGVPGIGDVGFDGRDSQVSEARCGAPAGQQNGATIDTIQPGSRPSSRFRRLRCGMAAVND